MPLGTTLLHSQGKMRANHEMKPWVHTEKKEYELQQGAALQREHLHLRLGSAAPLGLNKCVPD